MKIDKSKKTLTFLVVLMLVNALSYGTIIPLLYPFAERFGIGPVGLSLLFASFSLFQFIATPIIGRLSDQYGRRPLLLLSLFGTGISLIMFGLATTVWQLFVARILDGITGGNISVAQAVIADTTSGKDRAKAFGMLGASFGFGFLIGPAIGGFLSTYSLSAPFIFAGVLAIVATVFGYFYLEESLPARISTHERKEPIFNLGEMISTLKKPVVGTFIIASLFVSLAFNSFILGTQALTNDVLNLTTFQIGLFFSFTGLLGIIMQAFGVGYLLKIIQSKQTIITYSLLLAALTSAILFFAHSFEVFAALSFLFFITNAPAMPLLSGLLSESVDADQQGVILGINQSYVALGQIIGPLLAGFITGYSFSGVFLATGLLFATAFATMFKHQRQIARIEK